MTEKYGEPLSEYVKTRAQKKDERRISPEAKGLFITLIVGVVIVGAFGVFAEEVSKSYNAGIYQGSTKCELSTRYRPIPSDEAIRTFCVERGYKYGWLGSCDGAVMCSKDQPDGAIRNDCLPWVTT